MCNCYILVVMIEEKINEWNVVVEKFDVMSCWVEFDLVILCVYDVVYMYDFVGFGYNKIFFKGIIDGMFVFDNLVYINYYVDGKTFE